MKNILLVGNRSKNIPTKVQKPFIKAGNQIYLLILVSFHASGSGSAFAIPIRIQDSHINPDPHQILTPLTHNHSIICIQIIFNCFHCTMYKFIGKIFYVVEVPIYPCMRASPLQAEHPSSLFVSVCCPCNIASSERSAHCALASLLRCALALQISIMQSCTHVVKDEGSREE